MDSQLLTSSSSPHEMLDGSLVVIAAQDVVEWLEDKLSSLEHVDYNLGEIGAVMIETIDKDLFTDTVNINLGREFAAYMSHRYGATDKEIKFLHPIFEELYGILIRRIQAVGLERRGRNDRHGISFFHWSGGDLVVRYHPMPD